MVTNDDDGWGGLIMPIPIPEVKEGGDLYNAFMLSIKEAANRAALQKQQLENQYYAPNIQSEMGYRNALTNESKTMLPLKATELSQKNAFYPRVTQSEIENRNALTNQYRTMLPLDAKQKQLENEWYAKKAQATINAQNTLADYRTMGGAGASANQKDLNALQKQIALDNPGIDPLRANQIASAHLSGDQTLPTGEILPPLSGIAQTQLTQIQNRNSPVAVRNQAANMDVLVNDLESFDIDAVKALAGPQGKAKLLYAQTQMATNPNDPNIDPMARRFLSAMKQSIINMDSMRKAFGTSVVPDYVYNTVGKLSNPASSIWSDSTQVGQEYADTLKTMRKNRDLIMAKAQKGISAQAPEPIKSKATLRYNQETGNFEEIT